MVKDSYPFQSSPSFEVFRFESIGVKGVIVKLVFFQKIPGRERVWNLGFGDLTGKNVDDSIVSNNVDLIKVLSTIVQITIAFLARNPAAILEIKPVDEKRKRLYNHLFRRHFHEIELKIAVFGWIGRKKRAYRPELLFDRFEMSAATAVLESPAMPVRVVINGSAPIQAEPETDKLFAEISARLDAGEIFFPRKFFMSIRDNVGQDLARLHRRKPGLPLQEVVARIFSGFKTNQRFPADEVLKLTRFILDEWAKLGEPTS